MTTRRRRRVHTRHRVIDRTLVIDLGGVRRVLSSAPRGGGFTRTSWVLNHQVDTNPGGRHHRSTRWNDPARDLRKLASRLGVGADAIGLMTAVPMTQLVTARASMGRLWVECFATVGVTNAVRAGEWPPGVKINRLGTINLILITNGSLSPAAMVGAVQVVTEAKTGALRDHAVLSSNGRSKATGTGTDVVVIACRLRGQGPAQVYSGTHTIIGALMGKVVADCVARGLAKAKAWHEAHR